MPPSFGMSLAYAILRPPSPRLQPRTPEQNPPLTPLPSPSPPVRCVGLAGAPCAPLGLLVGGGRTDVGSGEIDLSLPPAWRRVCRGYDHPTAAEIRDKFIGPTAGP